MFDVFSFLNDDFLISNNEDNNLNLNQNTDLYSSDSQWPDFHYGLDNSTVTNAEVYPDISPDLTGNDLPQASLINGQLYIGDSIIGDPYNDMQFMHIQEGTKSCAVASQKAVLDSLGIDVPEIELSYMAYHQGWFNPASGTIPEDMGKILEVFNIPVERNYDYSVTDIYTALENDEKVIVGLNANEIWEPQYDAEGNPIEQQINGHAVWITGLYQDDNDNWFVVMNDSGRPDGAGETVPVADFINAWNDFGNFAVITNTHGQIASSPDIANENYGMAAAAQDISITGERVDSSDISYLMDVEGLAPTGDELNRLENFQPVAEQTGQISHLGSSSCSDCSGSCWLTCSGSCESSTD